MYDTVLHHAFCTYTVFPATTACPVLSLVSLSSSILIFTHTHSRQASSAVVVSHTRHLVSSFTTPREAQEYIDLRSVAYAGGEVEKKRIWLMTREAAYKVVKNLANEANGATAGVVGKVCTLFLSTDGAPFHTEKQWAAKYPSKLSDGYHVSSLVFCILSTHRN